MGADQADYSVFLQQAQDMLTSDSALFSYSWLGVGLAFVVSVVLALNIRKAINGFSENYFKAKFAGRNPHTEHGIAKRIDDINRMTSNRVKTVLLSSVTLLIFGVAVPGGLLIFIATHHEWFMPGSPPLIVDGAPVGTEELNWFQLAIFAVDQGLKGGLSDSLEVFGVHIGDVRHNPRNIVFSSLVIAYRTLASIVVLAILYVIWRAGAGVAKVKRSVAELKNTAGASAG